MPLRLTELSDDTKKSLGLIGAEGDELVIEDPTAVGEKGFNLKPSKRKSRAKKRKSEMPPENSTRKSPRIAVAAIDISSDDGSTNGAETGGAGETTPPVVATVNTEEPNPSTVGATGVEEPDLSRQLQAREHRGHVTIQEECTFS